MKNLFLKKVSFTCLLHLLHSTVWPDEVTIATEVDIIEEAEEEVEVQDTDETLEQKEGSNNNNNNSKSLLEIIGQFKWILDILSIDLTSIVPFVIKKFSSKEDNVTLIYNLINVFFARLKVSSNEVVFS